MGKSVMSAHNLLQEGMALSTYVGKLRCRLKAFCGRVPFRVDSHFLGNVLQPFQVFVVMCDDDFQGLCHADDVRDYPVA